MGPTRLETFVDNFSAMPERGHGLAKGIEPVTPTMSMNQNPRHRHPPLANQRLEQV